MDSEFIEVQEVSYIQNIKNSFIFIPIGLILFVASFILLWWNEGNSVRRAYAEDIISKEAIIVDANNIDRKNDLKLVVLRGIVRVDTALSDSILSIDNALKLRRDIEMYQWRERKETKTQQNIGGSSTKTTTYSYVKDWSTIEFDSDKFKMSGYSNPKFTLEDKRIIADKAYIGDFVLNSEQIADVGKYEQVLYLEPIDKNYKVWGKYYYKLNNPQQPEIGDVRISYEYVPSGKYVSIIGQQNSDNSISGLKTSKGEIYLQYDGDLSLDEMLVKYKHDNVLYVWGMRFLGWLMMCIGLSFLISPIISFTRITPVVEEKDMPYIILAVIAFLLSSVIILLAWIVYRPLLALLVLILICIGIYFLRRYWQSQKSYFVSD